MKKRVRFTQLVTAANNETIAIYGLSADGELWAYRGRSRATQKPIWELVEAPEVDVADPRPITCGETSASRNPT
jgi:hypothetical protein